MASFTFGLLTAIAAELPKDPLQATKQRAEANTYVYAGDGHTVLAILRGDQARIPVPSEDISALMKHSIVAIEDKRFYEHRGVDLRGIMRAVWADVRNKAVVEGGSTITQQFVKNSINQHERTISRKLREAALAWQLERRWPKDKILTAYLNTVYFGNRAYGVEQASRIYFKHSAKTMNWAEAALLAGIPQDPTLYDPVAHPQQARARRDVVLRALEANLFITHPQYLKWRQWPMPKPQAVRFPATHGQAAQYFANYVTEQLVDHYGAKRVYGGGLRVKTTIDLDLQKRARDAIKKVLPASIGPEAALVAIDPETGAVRAMVGGRNYHESQYNLATQFQRQPGSAFKAIVLATAVRDGIAPSTVFDSKPITINADGRLWQPENYEGEYLGPINIAQATAYSDNSVFSQLSTLIGPANVRQTAWDLGIDPAVRDTRGRMKHRLEAFFSIALGSEGVSPLEMARAYTAFANGGLRVDGSIFGNRPRVVECLADPPSASWRAVKCKGDAVNVPRGHEVLTPDQAALMDDLLQGPVRYGTAKAAQLPDRQVAGKTGTTENFGDAWFVGFTPQLVTAVWVGYPDSLRPMLTEYHGKPVAGGTFPALIWKEFTEKALAGEPPASFPSAPSLYASPVNVTLRHGRLERDNGVCTNTRQLVFYSGEEPKNVADCKPNEVQVPDVRGNTLADAKARLAAQPLDALVVYRPARAGERPGVVLGQDPGVGGRLSAGDQVTLVLAKPQHGVVPRLVGLGVAEAKARLKSLHLDAEVRGAATGKVSAQQPRPGVAAAPGMRVVVAVKPTPAGSRG
jgi:penicillin-binding protein 1A